MSSSELTCKVASTQSEFEQIHRLNYRTFVEEIPQHPPNPTKSLVDRFHNENTYCICIDGKTVVGMLAVRGARPFSLDGKVADLDRWLPPSSRLCEIRLLAVDPSHRHPTVFARLMHFAASHCIEKGYTLAVASGTLRQTRLYRRMGFVPFAEPVGTAEARYQPMYLSLHSALSLLARLKMETPELPEECRVSFLPGPVEVSSTVREAFNAAPVSHRSRAFVETVADCKRLLCHLTKAPNVELFLGSGTLGNDVVAARLKVLQEPGVVLSNGEFGERLADHASRMGLDFKVLRVPWGGNFNQEDLENFLEKLPEMRWLWGAHCETSSGVLNDVGAFAALCHRKRIKLCLDCTSSLGTVPVDLSEVYLASSVSGKGLASLPGIAMVFYHEDFGPDARIPRYLDIGYYRANRGVPFTHSSNLVAALHRAVQELDPPRRFESVRRQHKLLRRALSDRGIQAMIPEHACSPAVLSLQLPPTQSSLELGEALERRGYSLSYRSQYLIERNIIQICLMGNVTDEQCRNLVTLIPSVPKADAQIPPRQHGVAVHDHPFLHP